MDKNPGTKLSSRHSEGLRSGGESCSSSSGQSASLKRKANPDGTSRKRQRVSEMAAHCASDTVGVITRSKRKVMDDGEGPSQQKKVQKLDPLRQEESATSSVDNETSTDPLEGCSAFVVDVSPTQLKRKADAETERPSKKIRKSLDLREKIPAEVQRAQFEAKYRQDKHIGEGGCGSVFAGYRIADELPVAIKHIPKNKVFCKHTGQNGERLSTEVAVMLKLSDGTEGSVGTSMSVSLLDWYDLGHELVLVLERPDPCKDLYMYILTNGALLEEEAKIILTQLLRGLTELHNNQIFHRDIKTENILIETSSDVPRARLIDFGLSCFFKTRSVYRVFYGTPNHVPPEYFTRNAYRPEPTTVWQLGVVLYEMLHCVCFETISFLRQQQTINSELSKNCQDFLKMCLTKAPGKRPSLEELHLHPWLREADVNTPSPDTSL